MFSRFLSFFYPSTCSACGSHDRLTDRFGICKPCIRERKLAQQKGHTYPSCAICSQWLNSETGDCPYCTSRFVFFSQVVSLRFRFGWEHKIFQNCKFQNERILGNYFALDLFRKHQTLLDRPDYIVLLPSSDWKRGRDFHPAYKLAERLARKWGIEVRTGVKKISKEKQSGKMYVERFFHAKKAFVITKKDRIPEGVHILIIDDIFTTGASLNEVARMFLDNGAKKVSCMVLLSNEGD